MTNSRHLLTIAFARALDGEVGLLECGGVGNVEERCKNGKGSCLILLTRDAVNATQLPSFTTHGRQHCHWLYVWELGVCIATLVVQTRFVEVLETLGSQ